MEPFGNSKAKANWTLSRKRHWQVLGIHICGNIYQIKICIGFFFWTYTSNLVLTFKILAVKEHLNCLISLAERLRAPFNILKEPLLTKNWMLLTTKIWIPSLEAMVKLILAHFTDTQDASLKETKEAECII